MNFDAATPPTMAEADEGSKGLMIRYQPGVGWGEVFPETSLGHNEILPGASLIDLDTATPITVAPASEDSKLITESAAEVSPDRSSQVVFAMRGVLVKPLSGEGAIY